MIADRPLAVHNFSVPNPPKIANLPSEVDQIFDGSCAQQKVWECLRRPETSGVVITPDESSWKKARSDIRSFLTSLRDRDDRENLRDVILIRSNERFRDQLLEMPILENFNHPETMDTYNQLANQLERMYTILSTITGTPRVALMIFVDHFHGETGYFHIDPNTSIIHGVVGQGPLVTSAANVPAAQNMPCYRNDLRDPANVAEIPPNSMICFRGRAVDGTTPDLTRPDSKNSGLWHSSPGSGEMNRLLGSRFLLLAQSSSHLIQPLLPSF